MYDRLLSERAKTQMEQITLVFALISFLVHLAFILLYQFEVINFYDSSGLLSNPIAAIYTPFSFILLYEVYLLVYFLPKSITTYISKQYEIIMLIIIRRLFKDLANLKLSSDWFQIKSDLQFTYDIIAAPLLFYLIYLFYRSNKRNTAKETKPPRRNVQRFIRFKQAIALVLVPALLGLAVYSLGHWLYSVAIQAPIATEEFKDLNNIFFDEFFTVLIVTDVLLLLLSLFLTDQFHKVIRNSGFIISTILIRLSFSVEGLINTILIICAVVFGLLMLVIHNQYERSSIRNAVPHTEAEE